MARRLNAQHSETCKARIKVSQLLNLLNKEGLGKVELKQGQRASAMFLVNKIMPNPPEDKNVNVDGELRIKVEGV